MNTPIYIKVVAVTDRPALVWRCVAAVRVWPWRVAAAAAVPGMPTPAPVSPRPDWTPCRGDLGPPLIRRRALEGILPFDHHLGGGYAGCWRTLSFCSLWYLEMIPLKWATEPGRGIISWFLFKQTEKQRLLMELLLASFRITERTCPNVPKAKSHCDSAKLLDWWDFKSLLLTIFSTTLSHEWVLDSRNMTGTNQSPRRTEGAELQPGIAAGVSIQIPKILIPIPVLVLITVIVIRSILEICI